MRGHITFIPGWKSLLAITVPVLLAIGAVAGAYAYTSSTPKPAPATPDLAAASALSRKSRHSWSPFRGRWRLRRRWWWRRRRRGLAHSLSPSPFLAWHWHS